jgi:hypothetical protein
VSDGAGSIVPFLIAGIQVVAGLAATAGTFGVLGIFGAWLLWRYVPKYLPRGDG